MLTLRWTIYQGCHAGQPMAAVSCSRRLNMVKWPQTVPVSRNFAPGIRSVSEESLTES